MKKVKKKSPLALRRMRRRYWENYTAGKVPLNAWISPEGMTGLTALAKQKGVSRTVFLDLLGCSFFDRGK